MAESHHHHHHAHAPASGRTLLIALALTLVFAAVEAVGGWLAGSLALIGDAGHMVSDATALGMAALAAWISQRPPTERHSFGLQRAEIIAALVNGLFMLGIVAAIVWSAIDRLDTPRAVHAPAVIGVAAVGLLVNLIVAIVLSRGEHTMNTRAARLHVLADLLGSIAALAAGVGIWLSGWTPLDPLLSLFICVLILGSAVRLLWDVLHVIMEGVPSHLDLSEVGRAMAADDEVAEVHDLHIWQISSGVVALSAHVVIDDFRRWDAILARLQARLERDFGINHITLQPERAAQVVVQPVPHPRASSDRERF